MAKLSRPLPITPQYSCFFSSVFGCLAYQLPGVTFEPWTLYILGGGIERMVYDRPRNYIGNDNIMEILARGLACYGIHLHYSEKPERAQDASRLEDYWHEDEQDLAKDTPVIISTHFLNMKALQYHPNYETAFTINSGHNLILTEVDLSKELVGIIDPYVNRVPVETFSGYVNMRTLAEGRQDHRWGRITLDVSSYKPQGQALALQEAFELGAVRYLCPEEHHGTSSGIDMLAELRMELSQLLETEDFSLVCRRLQYLFFYVKYNGVLLHRTFIHAYLAHGLANQKNRASLYSEWIHLNQQAIKAWESIMINFVRWEKLHSKQHGQLVLLELDKIAALDQRLFREAAIHEKVN